MNGAPELADMRHFLGAPRSLALRPRGRRHVRRPFPRRLGRPARAGAQPRHAPLLLSGVARDASADRDQDAVGGAPCAARKIPKVANLPPGELNLATSLMGTDKRRAIERKSDEQIFRT